jgi:hypothetical protein
MHKRFVNVTQFLCTTDGKQLTETLFSIKHNGFLIV